MGLTINLDQSRQVLVGKSFHDYWLNLDGTVTEKTLWGRIIRWIENFLYNKTLCDICTVFQNTVNAYLRLHNDLQARVGDVSPEALFSQGRRVSFVAQFLASRNGRLFASPQTVQIVQGSLNLLPIPAQERTVNNLDHLDLEYQDPRIKILRQEDLALPPLSDEVLGLEAPDLKMEFDNNTTLFDLLDRYDELAPNREPPPENPFIWVVWKVQGWFREDEEKRALREMCRLIEACDSQKYNHPHRVEVYSQVELRLKACSHLLKDQTISADKRWRALIELIRMAPECVPRWLNESEKQFLFLSEKMLPIRALILQWKTQIIQDWIQESRPDLMHTNHYLNAVAAKWAQQLGLHSDVAAFDMYKEPLDDLHFQDLKAMIKKIWAERAVAAFREHINLSYKQEIYDLLVEAAKGRELPQPCDFVGTEYYDIHGKIKDRGVVRILRETLTPPPLLG